MSSIGSSPALPLSFIRVPSLPKHFSTSPALSLSHSSFPSQYAVSHKPMSDSLRVFLARSVSRPFGRLFPCLFVRFGRSAPSPFPPSLVRVPSKDAESGKNPFFPFPLFPRWPPIFCGRLGAPWPSAPTLCCPRIGPGTQRAAIALSKTTMMPCLVRPPCPSGTPCELGLVLGGISPSFCVFLLPFLHFGWDGRQLYGARECGIQA